MHSLGIPSNKPEIHIDAHDTRPLFMNRKGGTHHMHVCLDVLRPSEARFVCAVVDAVGMAHS